MSTPAKVEKNSRGRPAQLWLVVTFGESEIGHDDRETSTQGALDPDENFVRLKTPRFIHHGYSIYKNTKMPITKNSAMKCGVFHRTKLLVGVKRTLGASFTIVVADIRFIECHHQPKWIAGRPLEFFFRLWLVLTFGESEIGHDDRETSTQGALDPDEQLCSIEDPTFHCRVQRYRHLYVLHMLAVA
ncbi:predicted protein [Lichtheimia corymbifera JMRC:FSU:9682]|uniref:Uncharacterized protein n=1 Tax=Lichtheimia corymbifera JMRC:FSU:9682 TaxID=1263082 RepID=A0A068S131_9FUNG|nr:predicted protein [Lichtheimia corymbifera JMRC:FSU:9682]